MQTSTERAASGQGRPGKSLLPASAARTSGVGWWMAATYATVCVAALPFLLIFAFAHPVLTLAVAGVIALHVTFALMDTVFDIIGHDHP